jgi:hypothetical protein
MSAMSAFEVRATDMALVVQRARQVVEDWGHEPSEARAVASNAIAMFVCWLTAVEEARHRTRAKVPSFSKHVIERLPAVDDPAWSTCVMPKPSASLRQRAEALWGIRIAFTHANGDTDGIESAVNKRFALSAPARIPGVQLDGTRLDLSSCGLHLPIRTVVQIQEVLK